MEITDKYIVLNMFKVSQMQNGMVFAGKMRFSDLNQVYRLTERIASTEDNLFGSSNYGLHNINEEFFQRQISEEKVRKISTYLQESLNSTDETHNIFPSSLILYNRATETDEDIALTDQFIIDNYEEDLSNCFFRQKENCNTEDLYQLIIPRNANITLIVDGQHRFIGTQRLYDSIKKEFNNSESLRKVEDFEFIVTYLVGFDIYQVSKIFADVNFKQKPVNRSLYYDIFGSAPYSETNDDWHNEIRLAHDLAVHLNNAEDSPIKGMIKLLGKGYGLFSQSFFVDAIQTHVFKTGVWNEYISSYIIGDSKYRIIATFLKDYLAAIAETYPNLSPQKTQSKTNADHLVYSSRSHRSVLYKTTGLGAFIRLIQNIYPMVKSEPEKFKDNIKIILSKLPESKLEEILLEYAGAGSEGSQKKLYIRIKEKELDLKDSNKQTALFSSN